jgi:hypothetical protein
MDEQMELRQLPVARIALLLGDDVPVRGRPPQRSQNLAHKPSLTDSNIAMVCPGPPRSTSN